MKTIINQLKKPVVAVILLIGLIMACNKDLEFTGESFVFTPENLDEDAGTWDPVILSSNDQIAVVPPLGVSSPEYQQELASIKDLQSNLTEEKMKIIEYWKAGGIIRWNEIMRELVTRFNLPPAPINNETYPGPDPENPFADPMFPFSNPPYASRAYSYVSVAQYDALKAAWYYKFLYNQPSPCKVDPSIQALMPVTDLPAYPSEDAVTSGVTAEILKAMFPAAVEEITKKAADQRNAALWSGKASPGDISAGLALGKAVAVLAMARAANDGMKFSVGNPAIWKALEDSAIARGEIPWISLETPKRPPMLPLFGKVLAWNMSPQDIINERPGPPPSVHSEQMRVELEEVKNTVKKVTRDQIAMVHNWADGVNTVTPPGHWNEIATSFLRQSMYSEVRTARAYALLNMALHDAAVACWDVKFYYFNPRPSHLDPEIKTTTGVPNFPAYSSGHSTFSAAAATVLSYLYPQHEQYVNQLANEAALSRLYGGIHYRADIEVGYDHGKVVGQYTINYARGDGADRSGE